MSSINDFPIMSILSSLGFWYLGKACERACKDEGDHAEFLQHLPKMTIHQLSSEFKQHPVAFTTLPPLPIAALVTGYTAQFPEYLKLNNDNQIQGLSKLVELEVFESVYPNPAPPGRAVPFEHKPYRIHRDYIEIGSLWSNDDIKIIDRSDMHHISPQTHSYSAPRNTHQFKDGKNHIPTFPRHYITLVGNQLPNEMFELRDHSENLTVDALDIDLVLHSDNPKIEIGNPLSVGVREEEIIVPLGIQTTIMGEFYQDGMETNVIKIRPMKNPKNEHIYPPIISPLPQGEILEEYMVDVRRVTRIAKLCYVTSAALGLYANGQILRMGINAIIDKFSH